MLSHVLLYTSCFALFFFNDTATTEIYTLSLHDALPISEQRKTPPAQVRPERPGIADAAKGNPRAFWRSEEHTSELQSRLHLVCRLLLEKKKKREQCTNGSAYSIVPAVTTPC